MSDRTAAARFIASRSTKPINSLGEAPNGFALASSSLVMLLLTDRKGFSVSSAGSPISTSPLSASPTTDGNHEVFSPMEITSGRKSSFRMAISVVDVPKSIPTEIDMFPPRRKVLLGQNSSFHQGNLRWRILQVVTRCQDLNHGTILKSRRQMILSRERHN